MKRLLTGLVLGLVVGALFGYGLFRVLPDAMSGVLGYAFAAIVGVVIGLVAGKPIWAKGAGVEAGLKAGIGALLGCGLLLGLRYVPFHVPALADVPAEQLGRHVIGSLAAISTLLAVFYELDNSGGDDDATKHAPTRKRVSAPPGSKRVGAASPADEGDDEAAAPGKRKV